MTWDPEVAKARIILSRVAMRLKPFTSDDLRDVIEQENIPVKIQAVGAALAEAKSGENAWIVQVGEVPSRRPENHQRKIDVYVLANDGKPIFNDGLKRSTDAPVPAEQGTLSPLNAPDTPAGSVEK